MSRAVNLSYCLFLLPLTGKLENVPGCSHGRSALTQCNYLHFWVNHFLLKVQMENLWWALAICLLGKEEAMSLELFAEVDVRHKRVSLHAHKITRRHCLKQIYIHAEWHGAVLPLSQIPYVLLF